MGGRDRGGRHAGGGGAKPAKVDSKHLPPILEEIAEAVQWAETTPLNQWVYTGPQGEQARPLSLILYCRTGRHCSVALATGLEQVFTMRGYKVTVKHTESWGGWHFRCGYIMGRCEGCSLAERLQPLHDFVQKWYRAEAVVARA